MKTKMFYVAMALLLFTISSGWGVGKPEAVAKEKL